MLNEPQPAEPGTTSKEPFSSVVSTRGRGGISTVGTPSTVRPSALEAAAAVPRTRVSFSCTESTVVEAGTARVAVMITLAAATSIVTWDVSRPAMFAMFSCKLEVSE